MKIVRMAFYGPSGCGKDYILEKFIRSMNIKDHVIRFAFADPLKKMVGDMLGFDEEQRILIRNSKEFKNHTYVRFDNNGHIEWCEDEPKGIPVISSKQAVSARLPDCCAMTLREFLVYFGTYTIRKNIGSNVWCDMAYKYNNELNDLLKTAHELPDDNSTLYVCCTDLRFPSENSYLKLNGFKTINVIPFEKNKDNISNIAENYYNEFTPDAVIYNNLVNKDILNANVEELKQTVEKWKVEA